MTYCGLATSASLLSKHWQTSASQKTSVCVCGESVWLRLSAHIHKRWCQLHQRHVKPRFCATKWNKHKPLTENKSDFYFNNLTSSFNPPPWNSQRKEKTKKIKKSMLEHGWLKPEQSRVGLPENIASTFQQTQIMFQGKWLFSKY